MGSTCLQLAEKLLAPDPPPTETAASSSRRGSCHVWNQCLGSPLYSLPTSSIYPSCLINIAFVCPLNSFISFTFPLYSRHILNRSVFPTWTVYLSIPYSISFRNLVFVIGLSLDFLQRTSLRPRAARSEGWNAKPCLGGPFHSGHIGWLLFRWGGDHFRILLPCFG